MFFVLVKFKEQPVPRIVGTTHVDDCYALATMDDVEWVSHSITDSGHTLPRRQYVGHSLMGETKVIPILPEDGHHHVRVVAERMAKGVRAEENDAINRVDKGAE